jgi:hypothetical protein
MRALPVAFVALLMSGCVSAPNAAHLKPFTGRKQWLGYGHGFVYRPRSCGTGTTWRDLIDVGEHLTTRSVSYAERAGT